MNKTQDAFTIIDLDSEQEIEQIMGTTEKQKSETKVSHSTEIDWQSEAGKWALRFWFSVILAVVGLLIFAYVADSLSTENDILKSQIEMRK